MWHTLETLLKAREFGYSPPIATLTSQPDETAATDTYVDEALPTTNLASNAAISANGTAGSRRIALLKFDLSALTGKLILAATLYLHNITTVGSNQSLPLFAILAANSGWTEAGATWNYALASTTRWAGDAASDGGTDAGGSVAGTDYNATAIGTLAYLANTVANTEHAISLSVAQMQAMVAANYGILMRKTTSNAFSCHSANATTAAYRPKLVVSYRD